MCRPRVREGRRCRGGPERSERCVSVLLVGRAPWSRLKGLSWWWKMQHNFLVACMDSTPQSPPAVVLLGTGQQKRQSWSSNVVISSSWSSPSSGLNLRYLLVTMPQVPAAPTVQGLQRYVMLWARSHHASGSTPELVKVASDSPQRYEPCSLLRSCRSHHLASGTHFSGVNATVGMTRAHSSKSCYYHLTMTYAMCMNLDKPPSPYIFSLVPVRCGSVGHLQGERRPDGEKAT
jgi:hypothetical protein